VFFFEKKNQKTFARWRTWPMSNWPHASVSKSRLLLFFEKEVLRLPWCFLLSPAPSARM
jgi:hypothetical protein